MSHARAELHVTAQPCAAVVQEARIPTTLVGMATEDEVHQNADAALRAVGMAPNLAADKERAALAAVLETLQPVHNLSWPSGLPENS